MKYYLEKYDEFNIGLYQLFQDIPYKEMGSINKLNGLSYEEALTKFNEYKQRKDVNRYIMYIDNIPVGYIGIRLNNSDLNSQIFYNISPKYRGNKFGNIILKLGIKKCEELGFKLIRINCNNRNVKSKKVILYNGGFIDIKNYKTSEGLSSSYLIRICK